MNKIQLRSNFLLLLTAAIWGFAFAVQRIGAQYVRFLTFNGIRFTLGSLSLLPLIFFIQKKGRKSPYPSITGATLFAGAVAGGILFIAANMQQYAIGFTTAGKAGFITGLYIVLVPLLGICIRKKVFYTTWIGIFFAIVGLYLLSVNEDFTMTKGDLLVLFSSFFWALHILVIDYFASRIDPLKLSCVQFAVCGILCLGGAFIFESVSVAALKSAFLPLLYGGFLSVGVAFTLQVVAQKNTAPTQAAILLSMETVFSALGGALMLGEQLGIRELAGCALIFTAILVSQIPPKIPTVK